jgi:hypothetical protein
MPEFTEHKLYNGEVTIHFYPNSHAYYLLENGKKKRLCGVTSFLGILDKPALIPWAVKTTVEYIRKNLDQLQNDPSELLKSAKEEANRQKDIAAEIGHAIHKWIEQHIKNENPEMPEDEKVLQGVINFIDWVNDNKIEFIHSEKVVYSRTHGFIGTLDIVITINGKLYMLDIKTGNGIYSEVKAQTAAYLMAEQEESGTEYAGRYVLRISKETEEDYIKRMEEKGKIDYPAFKPIEPIFLDDSEGELENDFMGFLNVMNSYRWKQNADKILNNLRK